MAIPLPPVPYKSVVTDDTGFLSTAWAGWFREVFKRIGGNVSPSLLELSAQVISLQTTLATQAAAISALQIPSETLNQGQVL